MRLTKLFLLLIFTAVCFAQSSSERGVYVSDMDKSADPCNDFFDYANGAWRAANPIPASMVRWSRRWKSGEDAKTQLKDILDEVSAKKEWPAGSVEQLIGDHYGACTDGDAINKAGIAPLKPLLTEVDKIASPADVQRVIRHWQRMGISAPFSLHSASDNHNPQETIAEIGAAGLGLPDRDYYVKTEDRFKDAREKYLVHVANMFKLVGYSDADAKAAADSVMQTETALAKASLDNVELRDPAATDHKVSFADLGKMTPHFDWAALFQSSKVPKEAVNVDEPKFMAEVDRQLTADSVAQWKNYLKWQLLNNMAGALSDPFVEEDFNFNGKYLAGQKELKPRWKRCVESTDNLLGEALGKKYVEKYFPPEAKVRMQDMVKNLLSALGDVVQGLDWMSPQTKQKAMEKLSTFNPKIGYPDKWIDYSSVKINRKSFFDDVVAASQFDVQHDLDYVGKPTDRGRWGMTPPTSNAYYNPLLNEVVFPAGILQPPAFDMNATDAVNYGAIGVVIGHEISHGFDDQGAQYDAQGRLQKWWTDADYKNFQTKTACVANQFDNYFIEPGIHHNGKLVLGESIGDLAGAKIAFLAYQKSRKGKGPEPTIDGFTPEQQFFIAWGQFRGDEIRPETQRMMVQGDPHPIGKYRVIGPLSNLPQFQQTFACKAGDAMVRPPDKRCEVW